MAHPTPGDNDFFTTWECFHTSIAFLVKWFLKNANKFSLTLIYLPLKVCITFHLYKLESLSPKDALC